MERRRERMLAWVVVSSVLVAGVGGCEGGGAGAGREIDEDQLAQQIQRELDVAATADPATAARTRGVRPVVACVENLGGNRYRGHFGYVNSGASALSIPFGFFNRFWPPPIDRGQPTTLIAGTQTDVVQVPFDGFRAAIWVLGNHFAIASKFSRRCPASGGTGGVTGLGGMGVGGGLGGMGVGGFAGGLGGRGVGGFENTCPSNCDDRNPCTLDRCDSVTVSCFHVANLDGTSCDDGNACTLNDNCQAGECVGGSPKICGAAAFECHLGAVCDPATGVCSNPPQPDGTSCSRSSTSCSTPGSCQAGVCQLGTFTECSVCQQCAFGSGPGEPNICATNPGGCNNCVPDTDGCQGLADPNDRRLCQDLYACIITPTHPGTSVPGACDPLKCWCGTNPTTCVTSNVEPTKANGPCLNETQAAAKISTYDAAYINQHLIDPNLPLGRAVNIANCQGSFCVAECRIPF